MYKFGRLLSAIVSQNIAIIIAIGLVRAIFGVYGWFPNDNVNLLVGPLLNWLVPVLFAYSGGHLMGGKRGGAVAAIVVFGLALASTVSMIFMAFLLGPILGWIVSRIERLLENRFPSGIELLAANFLSAVLAGGLSVICFTYVGQEVSSFILRANDWILQIAYSGWLPISAAVIEPAKVLFLNNVMSYGILGPIGISQVKDLSKSIFFLLESNPGPAIGVLLAHVIRLKGKLRRNAASTLAIHSLGGIQEVYFPYVLTRPQLLLPLILGNMTGIYVFQYWNAGLVSIPSPASLLLIAGLAPPGDIWYVFLGISVSAAVSLLLSLAVLGPVADLGKETAAMREQGVIQRLSHVDRWKEVQHVLRPAKNLRPNEPPAQRETEEHAEVAEPKPSPPPSAAERGRPITVCFACDAGMGSSAMGAAMLRKKLRASNFEHAATVVHASLDQIPEQADMIVTHHYLLKRAVSHARGRLCVSIDNYTDPAAYEKILEQVKALSAEGGQGGNKACN
ncbi:PTS mannitol transporter subunit IIBC [Cohnella caldifontis]|uniref:PTS mannitol transporter subunit IIBC n=1 Tax=Cohnella caldifontis TaxID=3027471 RepID=UPI0023EB2936|nr:PTS mannitol transporter subunit IIBC [Cohnella sp. YIM B05605]